MRISIDREVIEMFPDVKLGVLVIKNAHNTGAVNSREMLGSVEAELREKYQIEQLVSLPKVADWRTAYRRFGAPASFRNSIEALLRRIMQGKEIPSINPIVDLYNLVSIRHILPLGGDDIDYVTGEICLSIADGTERFIKLGCSEPEAIPQGEIVYRDDQEVLCRSWNYRECEKSKITPQTKNACFVIEGLKHTSREEIMEALSDLKHLLATHCKGEITLFFLDKESPSFAINT
ncbi:MAG TPA: phenylalanine--tRNA ligase beta subunit-related protein [Rhabdochlamydiaceae bacterium]|jgi:lysyl-tRNA synthetase class 2